MPVELTVARVVICFFFFADSLTFRVMDLKPKSGIRYGFENDTVFDNFLPFLGYLILEHCRDTP